MIRGSRSLVLLRGTEPTPRRLGRPSGVGSAGDSCSNIEVGARPPGFRREVLGCCDLALAFALVLSFSMLSASSCSLGFLRLKGLREIERRWREGQVCGHVVRRGKMWDWHKEGGRKEVAEEGASQ